VAVFVQHQGTDFEFTVVPKLHQGTAAKRGVIVWRATFFVSFLEKQKRKEARGRRQEVAKYKAFMVKSISFIHP